MNALWTICGPEGRDDGAEGGIQPTSTITQRTQDSQSPKGNHVCCSRGKGQNDAKRRPRTVPWGGRRGLGGMPDLWEGQIIISTGYVILESSLLPNGPPHLFFCHLFCLPLLLSRSAEPGSALGSASGWLGLATLGEIWAEAFFQK